MEIDAKKGIINEGDFSRLKRVFEKGQRGEPLTIGFIGGSITQGCLSSVPQTCYAYRVYEWWKKKFEKSEVTYVNAGIGGTPSDFGVARVEEDLLVYKPDFVIVEFSVNDGANDYYKETYEGLIRRILTADCKPALVLVHSVCYDSGSSAEDIHLEIGRHYKLTSLSMKSAIYEKILEGSIKNRDITPDDLHPNDAGHLLMSDVITYYLDKVYSKSERSGENFTDDKLPKPLTKNLYEKSLRLNNTNFKPELCGFLPDTTPQNHITEMFRKGFEGRKRGDSIFFDVEASCISVQFRKTIRKPSPVAGLVIDGDEENAVILDGNFDEDWGDCLTTLSVLHEDVKINHNVKVTIIEDHSDICSDETPFYLTSLIVS